MPSNLRLPLNLKPIPLESLAIHKGYRAGRSGAKGPDLKDSTDEIYEMFSNVHRINPNVAQSVRLIEIDMAPQKCRLRQGFVVLILQHRITHSYRRTFWHIETR